MDRANCVIEDPRSKSNRYSKGARTKFDPEQLEFESLQFLIDDHYVGQPPRVQVSIDNLNDNVNEDFLRKEMTKLGRIRSLEIVRHPISKIHLGMAKIQFEHVSAAKNCIEKWNNRGLMGKNLNVFEDPRFAGIDKIKEEKLNPRPPPPPAPTISSISSFSAFSTPVISTPEPSSRPRLDDRIAILMKRPDSLLNTIVAQPAMPVPLSDYPNSIYYNDNRRPEVHHLANINHYPNHKEPYHKYDHNEGNNDGYHKPQNNSNLDKNKTPNEVVEPKFNIELTSDQISEQVLPYSFERFTSEMYKSLRNKLCQHIIERHGYDILDKYQEADKKRRNKERLMKDKENTDREQLKKLEANYLAKNRNLQPQAERPRLTTQFQRKREGTDNYRMDNKRPTLPQRINRSAAVEPEKRGSHNAFDSESNSSRSSSSESSSESGSGSESDSDSDFSDSSSSSGSSRSSSGSSSSSSSRSSCSVSSRSSASSIAKGRNKRTRIEIESPKSDDIESKLIHVEEDEQFQTACALLALHEGKDTSLDGIVRKTQKTTGTKRKKKADENLQTVASEYRPAKRFASDPAYAFDLRDENIENAGFDEENLLPEPKVTFPPRSDSEKERMLHDLVGTLDDEDLKYLQTVHDSKDGLNANSGDDGDSRNTDSNDVLNDQEKMDLENRRIEVPFGSINANKAHLEMRRDFSEMVIEGKLTRQPKWWNGCSRCSVIPTDQRDKPSEEVEMDYADLTMAPIKSHVIQAATTNSSRREQRGDQRRIAAANSNIGEDFLRAFVSNTLKMRAKNLRFSRSKIHKWGLFACEKIAKDEAVIEYVGEKIRPSVADHREKVIYTNLSTHDGSSYFFRVESDVIDATLKGNKARFINHSCNPNCIAKVIKHEYGSNSIVIYAKQAIAADEEITYDYKFPREETDQKIRCNCRAPNCQKYLN